MTDPTPAIPDDDATLRSALEQAHVPTLMLALVHLTGDTEILRGDIRPELGFLGDPQGGVTEEQQAYVRGLAFDALRALRDGEAPLPEPPSREVVREMMHFLIGPEIPENTLRFLESELALRGEDPYAQPAIENAPQAAKADFPVLIIGAGMSGLLAAVRLKEAGLPFVIVEKNAGVGGTWYENTYPGCRVDSPNHTYSYSFRPNDWPQHFSRQEVLREYFEGVADDYGLRDAIRFETEVTTARFDETNARWHVELQTPSGGTDTLEVRAIISAVGQLNRPKLPDIPGLDRFEGPCFHSARWEHEHDLTGKRIGVIGTGASAFQCVPILAEQAESVTVFQRTPPWVIPNPEYFEEVPEGKHWLLRHVPFYGKWFRFVTFWRTSEGVLAAVRRDPEWKGHEDSVSPMNEMMRLFLIENVKECVGDDPDLLEKTIPHYPPGAKRALIDDGTWLRSLTRDNVQLLTDPIAEITPQGLRTKAGVDHEFDALVLATGFHASRFLHPMKIFGRGGVELHDQWGSDPRAYMGITVPGFPNLFCCYGPNTNIVVNGSIVFFSECEMRYILGCLALLLERGASAMDCRTDVHDAYNRKIDEGNLGMAWSAQNVNSWYKNEKGRVTQNWPFTMVEFWEQTRDVDPDDYEFL